MTHKLLPIAIAAALFLMLVAGVVEKRHWHCLAALDANANVTQCRE